MLVSDQKIALCICNRVTALFSILCFFVAQKTCKSQSLQPHIINPFCIVSVVPCLVARP